MCEFNQTSHLNPCTRLLKVTPKVEDFPIRDNVLKGFTGIMSLKSPFINKHLSVSTGKSIYSLRNYIENDEDLYLTQNYS